MVSFLINAIVTIVIVAAASAIVETLRRLGINPVGRIAGILSGRDANGIPFAASANGGGTAQ